MLVDLWFPITGRSLPSDHGYAMYGALCRVVPGLHGAPWWGLHTVRGVRGVAGSIILRPGARLGLRIPADRIPSVLPLAGRGLDVFGQRVLLAAPVVEAVSQSPALSARIVTIKPFVDPEDFQKAVLRQLAESELGIQNAEVSLGSRKIITIDKRRVVGFSVRIAGLSSEESLLLLEHGLGGRRRMGCGVFRRSERDLSPDVRPRMDD